MIKHLTNGSPMRLGTIIIPKVFPAFDASTPNFSIRILIKKVNSPMVYNIRIVTPSTANMNTLFLHKPNMDLK